MLPIFSFLFLVVIKHSSYHAMECSQTQSIKYLTFFSLYSLLIHVMHHDCKHISSYSKLLSFYECYLTFHVQVLSVSITFRSIKCSDEHPPKTWLDDLWLGIVKIRLLPNSPPETCKERNTCCKYFMYKTQKLLITFWVCSFYKEDIFFIIQQRFNDTILLFLFMRHLFCHFKSWKMICNDGLSITIATKEV